jgi:hypothetical protein
MLLATPKPRLYSNIASACIHYAHAPYIHTAQVKHTYTPTHTGRDVYVDVAGWHLFLRDMNAAPGVKMSTALANQFGPEVSRSHSCENEHCTDQSVQTRGQLSSYLWA